MPTIFSKGGLAAATSGAKADVYKTLAQGLPPDWRVWCDVKVRIPGPVFGECDFIIANPAHGLLVLWLMDGRIENIQGRWYRNQQEMLSSPMDQAQGFRSKLLRALKDYGVSAAPVSVAVCFPESDIADAASLSKSAGSFLAAADIANLPNRLSDLLAKAEHVDGGAATATLAALDRLWHDGHASASELASQSSGAV